jgi:ketosteroid isomerase-like protein
VGDVSGIMDRAALLYRDGEITRFENIATYVTPQLAYIVEVERFTTRIAGRDAASVALRTTSIFRPEDGTWKIVHRHADAITNARPAESVIQP